jgi:hypothetical protein
MLAGLLSQKPKTLPINEFWKMEKDTEKIHRILSE